MQTYTIRVPDGRTVKIRADSPEVATADAEAWAKANPRRNGMDMARGFQAGLARGAIAPMIATSPVGLLAQGADTISRFMGGNGVPTPEGLARSLAGGNYQPTTREGRAARAAGDLLPALAVPGGVIPRAVSYLAPLAGGEVVAEIATRLGVNEEAGRITGQLAGGVGSTLRRADPPRLAQSRPPAAAQTKAPPRITRQERQAARVEQSAIKKLQRRARQLPDAVRGRVAEYQGAAIEPALVDVLDESGRAFVRAAASRQTPARETAQNFARDRGLNLPDRMGKQARRIMSDDPRTPKEIAEALAQQRSQAAQQAMAPIRGQLVEIGQEGRNALQSGVGRSAIADAAMRERDPQVAAMLRALADDPNAPMTVGMADRISRVLGSKAQAAFRSGDNDLGLTFKKLSDLVRGPARESVPQYGAMLSQYGDDSRIMGYAEKGEDFLKRNTDEFAASLRGAAPEELALARATGRRAIESAAGESTAAAPGVARRLAYAPEQQARNRALLGNEDATRLQDAMRLEEQLVQNARFIAPNTGSQTFGRAADALDASGAFDVAKKVMRRDWFGIADNWLRSRGLSNAEAQRIVEMATDPAQLAQALQLLERRLGPQAVAEFVSLSRQGLLTQTALPLSAHGAPLSSASTPPRREQR